MLMSSHLALMVGLGVYSTSHRHDFCTDFEAIVRISGSVKVELYKPSKGNKSLGVASGQTLQKAFSIDVC